MILADYQLESLGRFTQTTAQAEIRRYTAGQIIDPLIGWNAQIVIGKIRKQRRKNIFNIVPSLDRYLEKKYKDEFRDYAKKTNKLIPLIY